jgi:hypothetical protein
MGRVSKLQHLTFRRFNVIDICLEFVHNRLHERIDQFACQTFNVSFISAEILQVLTQRPKAVVSSCPFEEIDNLDVYGSYNRLHFVCRKDLSVKVCEWKAMGKSRDVI